MVFNKARLGFNTLSKQWFLKNTFVKAIHKKHSITYFKCNKFGHKAINCNLNNFKNVKYEKIKIKQMWLSKGTIQANPKGSKLVWIPKKTWYSFYKCAWHPIDQQENGILTTDV